MKQKFIVQMQICNLCYRQRFENLITTKLEKDQSDDDYDVNDDKNNKMQMIMMMMIRIRKLW